MPTTDRLRHDIDQGRAGDKVPFADPAAAPLGTDDEAAGTPASREDIEVAYRTEMGGGGWRAPSETDERGRDYSGELDPDRKRRNRVRAIYMLVGGGFVLTMVLWLVHG